MRLGLNGFLRLLCGEHGEGAMQAAGKPDEVVEETQAKHQDSGQAAGER